MKLQKRSSNGYAVLLNKVRKILIEGQKRIEAERLRTYWETGRVIHVDILKHKDRAERNKRVIEDLTRDLGVSDTVLHRCVKFAQKYPRFPKVAGGPLMKWSHYRSLITIADDKERSLLEKRAVENAWSPEELASRIKGNEAPGLPVPRSRPTRGSVKPLTPLRGTLHTYQIVKRPSVNADAPPELRVDLGFGVFHKVDGRLLSGFNEGDIVESRPKEDAYKFVKTDRTAKDLYTYAATIEKVIDGDTLKVRFDLGFNTEIRETLRLRGIDCPEMDTKEGQAAKAFVQSYLKEAQMVIVRSSRSDKYDRYLADVFISPEPGMAKPDGPQGEESDPQTDIYLNNLLLEHGHAVRME